MQENILWSIMILFIFELVLYSRSDRLNKHFPQDPQIVNIVGLFSDEETDEQHAFESAIDDVNADTRYLKKTKLKAHLELIDLRNAFEIKHKLCHNMRSENGITGIFGANTAEGISLVQSIADTFQIPYFFASWPARTYTNSTAFNFFPQVDAISKGIEQIIRDMDWNSFTLLYEKDEDFALFQDLLINHSQNSHKDNYKPIKLRRLPESDEDIGPLLKKIQNESETRIVLRCSPQNILPILLKAKELNLMGDYFAYVVISLDAHTVNFSEFIPTFTNITIISMIDNDSFDGPFSNYDSSVSALENVTQLKTRAFLAYDSVYFFAKALDRFLEDELLQQRSIDCDMDTAFENGPELVNILKATEMEGTTGKMKFSESGDRIFHTIQIIQVSPKENNKLGTWNPDSNIDYTRNETQRRKDEEDLFINKTFVVSSILSAPYLMECQSNSAERNDDSPCYEGFSKDLITLIAKDLKFDYKLVLAPDRMRGSKDAATGKWNGIIKELQERRADLGICDLTITSDRRKVVDFTKPFMSLGISILYRKGKEKETHLFSFLQPLEFQVWLCVATSLLGVSILLFIVSRFSPYDWESSHPCDAETEELENNLSLVNCLWFSLGSVLQQGCDILPKAVSSRMVAAMWWFFTLIMVSTYTANLAAFLTSQQLESEIKDVEALASQSVIKYGCQKEGSTGTFFKQSNEALYQKMWATMESTKPSVFEKNNDEGKSRVLRDKQYAFFMESSTIEYIVERYCDLTQVGGLLDSKGYGIAMPLNSPYRTQITASLLKQQENGNLKEIKKKWWVVSDESKKCKNEHKEDEENALDVSNVGGVFVVLIVGILFSFILSIMEFLWNIRKVAVVEKIPLSAAFKKELHFILNCSITTKPVRKQSENASLAT